MITYARLLIRDADGRTLGLRTAADPERWELPGGRVEHGSPFRTALAAAGDQLALDLAAGNPEHFARQRLTAMIHQGVDQQHQQESTTWVFDGGQLSKAQQAAVLLDTEQHTEWAMESDYTWRRRLSPEQYRADLQVLRAARSDRVLYLERPVPRHQDWEGIVAFVTTPDRELLVHHRDDKPNIAWPDHQTPIGGWRESDEAPEETAAREIREEAGIVVDPAALVELPGPRHERVGEMSRVLHTVYTGPKEAIRLGDEGQGIAWVPFEQIAALKTPPYVGHYVQLIAAQMAS